MRIVIIVIIIIMIMIIIIMIMIMMVRVQLHVLSKDGQHLPVTGAAGTLASLGWRWGLVVVTLLLLTF